MKLHYRMLYEAEKYFSAFRDALFPAYPVDEITADFFVSMGCCCKTAHHLRRNRLRICSSPLDWMINFTLKDALELFRTGFSTFFADIREVAHEENGKMRRVEDVRNGMLSIHHFPLSLTLEEGRAAYREKAARHFANTHEFMSKADRFAMVTSCGESLGEIREFVEGMAALYTADIVHVNVRTGTDKKREVLHLPNGATLYDYTFMDIGVFQKYGIESSGWWAGNDYEWRRILRRCRRTPAFSPPENVSGKCDSHN